MCLFGGWEKNPPNGDLPWDRIRKKISNTNKNQETCHLTAEFAGAYQSCSEHRH